MKNKNEDIIYETVKVNRKRRAIISVVVFITFVLATLSIIIVLAYTNGKNENSVNNDDSTELSVSNSPQENITPRATSPVITSSYPSATPSSKLFQDYLEYKSEGEKFDIIVNYLKKAGSVQNEKWTMYLTMDPAIFLTYGYNTAAKTETLSISIVEIDNKNNMSWIQSIELIRDSKGAIFQTIMVAGNNDDNEYRLYSVVENKAEYKGGLGSAFYDGPNDYDYYIRAHAVELINDLFENIDNSFSMHGLDVTIAELGFSSYNN